MKRCTGRRRRRALSPASRPGTHPDGHRSARRAAAPRWGRDPIERERETTAAGPGAGQPVPSRPVILVVDDNAGQSRHARAPSGAPGLRGAQCRRRARRARDARRTPGRPGAARRDDAGSGRLCRAPADEGRSGAARHPRAHDLGARRDGERGALHRARRRGLPSQAVRPVSCSRPASAPVWRRSGSTTRRRAIGTSWRSGTRRSSSASPSRWPSSSAWAGSSASSRRSSPSSSWPAAPTIR